MTCTPAPACRSHGCQRSQSVLTLGVSRGPGFVVRQLRKLFLTGYVMLFPRAEPHRRALSAIVLTLSMIVLMLVRASQPLRIRDAPAH